METSARPVVSRLPLELVRRVDRPLSASEYYHASTGRHPRSLIPRREVVFVVEGDADADASTIGWRTALDRAADMNPGSRLRLVGRRQNARWISDGNPPRLRIVEECDWDGRSDSGSEFIHSTPLSLEDGDSCELIVAGRQRIKVILRASHAAMDGIGVLHFLQEIFRALRGEPLLGTNAVWSDTELKKSVPSYPVPADRRKQGRLAGIVRDTHGNQGGGTWRRLTLDGPQPNLLPRMVSALAEFSRKNESGPVRIAIPSNLRRHVPGMLSTMNFTGMTYLGLAPTEPCDPRHVRERLKDIQNRNLDATHAWKHELIRYLPFALLDGLLSGTAKGSRSPPMPESAVLTVLGAFRQAPFSGGGFAADRLYVLPQMNNVFLTVTGLQGKFDACVGMPLAYAGEGRMEALLAFLEHRLKPEAGGSGADGE